MPIFDRMGAGGASLRADNLGARSEPTDYSTSQAEPNSWQIREEMNWRIAQFWRLPDTTILTNPGSTLQGPKKAAAASGLPDPDQRLSAAAESPNACQTSSSISRSRCEGPGGFPVVVGSSPRTRAFADGLVGAATN